MTHSEIKVAVVDERCIFGRFAIEFRGFGKLGFLVCWRRRGAGRGACGCSFSQLSDEVSKLINLLLEFGVGNHRFTD
jgi:hypothetical protein